MAEMDSFGVNPTNNPLPGFSTPSPSNAAPKQLERMGDALLDTGAKAAAIYTDVLREQNETRTLEALTQANDAATRLRAGENGYLTLLGKNALERPDGKALEDEYAEVLDRDADEIEKGLGNSAQRRAFRERYTAMRGSFVEGVRQHSFKQSQQYKTDTYSGAIASGVRQLGMSGGDPAQVSQSLAAIDANTRALAAHLGLDPETTEEKVREAKSLGHLAVVEQLEAAGENGRVEAYYKEHRADLTTEAYAKLSAVVQEGADRNKGESVTQSLIRERLSGAPGTPDRAGDVLFPLAGTYRRTDAYGAARPGRKHKGVDLAANEGTPVTAGGSGTLRLLNDPEGYGKYVQLKLDDGKTEIRLAHLSAYGKFKDGERVKAGDIVGHVGSTGRSSGPHLHYEVRVNGEPVDPEKWHAGKPTSPMRGGAGGPLNRVEMYDELERRLDASGAGPRARQAAKAELDRWLSADDYDRRQREEADEDMAWRLVEQGKPLPASLRARAPRVALQTDDYRRAKQEQANGKRLDPAVSRDAFYTALGHLAERPLTYADIVRLEPTMNRDDFEQFRAVAFKQQQDNLAAVGNYPGYKKSVKDHEDDLLASGAFETDEGKLTPEGQERYTRFTGEVAHIMHQEEIAGGRPISEARRREIILGEAARHQRTRNMDDFGDKYRAIPPGDRTAIYRSLLRRQGGVGTVTRGAVMREWERRQGL